MELTPQEARTKARRLQEAAKGTRDPQRDYSDALEAYRKAHASYKASSTKNRGAASAQSSEIYAQALRYRDFCEMVVLSFCEIRRIA